MKSINLTRILSFGIDYLEIYGNFLQIQTIKKGLDFDNSNISSYKEYVCMYSDAKNYKYKVTFLKDNIPCFAYYEGIMVSESITTKNYFIVYGKAFRVLKLDEILSFIRENLDIDVIRRLDLAMDVSEDIENVLNEFKELNQKGAKIYGEGGKIQTQYIGEKQNRFNRSLLIRIYDKIADIQAKGLQFLYPEYRRETGVTRLELEFRPELCKNLPFDKLSDKDYLFALFVRYIEKHTDIFKGIECEKIEKLVRPRKKAEFKNSEYQIVIPKRYENAFFGYSKGILKLGGCPIDMLIRNNLYRVETILNLNATMKQGKISPLAYKFGITSEEIPEKYLRSEYQTHPTPDLNNSPMFDHYTPPEDYQDDSTMGSIPY